MTCEISGCKFNEAYAVLDDQKIYRITFSYSLAKLIAKNTGKQIKRIKLVIGSQIIDLDKANSKLIAICKLKSGWPLRVTMFKEAAKMWQSSSTTLNECYVIL